MWGVVTDIRYGSFRAGAGAGKGIRGRRRRNGSIITGGSSTEAGKVSLSPPNRLPLLLLVFPGCESGLDPPDEELAMLVVLAVGSFIDLERSRFDF